MKHLQQTQLSSNLRIEVIGEFLLCACSFMITSVSDSEDFCSILENWLNTVQPRFSGESLILEKKSLGHQRRSKSSKFALVAEIPQSCILQIKIELGRFSASPLQIWFHWIGHTVNVWAVYSAGLKPDEKNFIWFVDRKVKCFLLWFQNNEIYFGT